jgi:protein SCO1/2
MPNNEPLSRRSFLQALVAAPIIHGHGRIVPPLPAPDIALLRYDGVATSLLQTVRGHATAVQLMFTSCTTTCPIEAAIFARVQKMLPGMADRGIQLLSLSVDPQSDTPKALSAWRRRFRAGPNWIAAAPAAGSIPLLQGLFGQNQGAADHSTQVQIFDRSGRLVWRTSELPTPGEITTLLQRIGG